MNDEGCSDISTIVKQPITKEDPKPGLRHCFHVVILLGKMRVVSKYATNLFYWINYHSKV